jgi:hypothetical protein
MHAPVQTPPNPLGHSDPASPPPPEDGHESQAANPAAQAFHDVPIFVAELKSYGRYLIGAKIDRTKAGMRQTAIYAVLGVMGLLAAAGMLFTGVFLILGGLALGLGELLGSRLWLGALIVGIATLGIIGLGMWLAIQKITKAWRLKTEQKYAGKQIEQRGKFGHDIHERAGRA